MHFCTVANDPPTKWKVDILLTPKNPWCSFLDSRPIYWKSQLIIFTQIKDLSRRNDRRLSCGCLCSFCNQFDLVDYLKCCSATDSISLFYLSLFFTHSRLEREIQSRIVTHAIFPTTLQIVLLFIKLSYSRYGDKNRLIATLSIYFQLLFSCT